jgi:hypothetical protein
MTIPPDSTGVASNPRRFRWRIIAVALVATFGGLFLLAGVSSFFLMAYTTWRGGPLYAPGPSGFSKDGLFTGVWGICCGSVLIVSAIQWWKGRWRLALAIIGACMLLAKILSVAGITPE